jgi:hypothetical protein
VPLLTIFRGAFVGSLRANIGTNLDKYLRHDAWVNEIGNRSIRDLETRIELKGPIDLEPDPGKEKDLENAIRMHKALQQLTPLQARDPRLWTRLAHIECWRYMRSRWELERSGSDTDKGVRFITSRYFIAQDDSRALLRNGIARLWWTAHMSFDPTRSNPYELTAVLLYTLDITLQILERNIGRAPVVLTGFLEFLLQNRSVLLTGGELNRVRIRKLAIGLNLYGGVCLLDCLSQMDVLAIMGAEFQRILEGEKVRGGAVKA